MIHPDTYIKSTPKGIGLFAKRRFDRGSILWIADDIDVKIPLADYLLLDGMQQQKLNVYSYLDYQNRVIIPWDEGKYVNHSCVPNSTGILEFDNISIALRPIEADEEIVEDYYCYYGHFETFSCCCGAPGCRGTIAQFDSYRADLRLRLIDIRSALLRQPQELLRVKSSENDAFFFITSPILSRRMNEQAKWVLVLVGLELVSLLADYLIKKASLQAGMSGWVWLVSGGLLYGATALGWFFMMRSFKLFTIGVLHSFGVIVLSLLLSQFIFREKITLREGMGLLLGCLSIGLLVRFR